MIRPATIADRQEIINLITDSWTHIDHQDYKIKELELIKDYFLHQNFDEVLEQQQCYLIIIENKLLAFGAYDKITNQITHLYVHHQYLNWHFAKKLLALLEQAAFAAGFFEISVNAYLTSVAFFQNNNYHAIKRHYYEWNNRKIITFFMKKYF
ncbi:GNAT family N-acetyltransferase [Spiroplasma eriocheiris]|uniref:Acetyltransferase n=1 Tax=Spiroplasma eriocheiris TaxID=315358 RepID=A0A0H3XI86_9MOLU|nr:GNAT family N-acetyltransferase [Spiroplasma eriocheiris]AHF57719.1 putative acetyltransferase [Spiroplasma eriocheiris CCTCC M 207170]AKM54170.1 acetyltransferase [Spiroplasma eriocheiris]